MRSLNHATYLLIRVMWKSIQINDFPFSHSKGWRNSYLPSIFVRLIENSVDISTNGANASRRRFVVGKYSSSSKQINLLAILHDMWDRLWRGGFNFFFSNLCAGHNVPANRLRWKQKMRTMASFLPRYSLIFALEHIFSVGSNPAKMCPPLCFRKY